MKSKLPLKDKIQHTDNAIKNGASINLKETTKNFKPIASYAKK